MSGHDFKCRTSIFTSHGGEVVQDGKSNWPDHLIVELPLHDAWRIVNELLGAIERGDVGLLNVALLGKLEESDEEE